MQFAEMVKYKCELEGIVVTYHEEYTKHKYNWMNKIDEQ